MDVSIIVPTYNRLWSLPKTIDSCKSNFCKIEIIVVDDGSTDGSFEWLQQQTNIKLIRQQNWGKCWAANKGFEIATGKYVRFLDSDDLLDENAIDEQFALAEKENANVVVSGYKIINEENEILKTQKWIYCNDFIAQQLGECDSSHYSAYLFEKEFITDIPHRPDFAFRDDRLFVLEVALKNPKISIHTGCALLHRTHQKERLQLTSKSNKNIQNLQHFNIYKKVLSQLSISEKLNERRIDASTKMLWPLAHWIAINNIKEANEIVKWIYELNPNFQIPNKGFLGYLYNNLGFKNTEYFLRLRRHLIIFKD